MKIFIVNTIHELQDGSNTPGGRGVVLNRNMRRGVNRLNKTLTLFKTQRCQFCYLA